MIKGVLVQNGYEVIEEACDGDDAISKYKEQKYRRVVQFRYTAGDSFMTCMDIPGIQINKTPN